jgi:lincosamide nucleotidyltransferase A/C/D/E
MVNGGDVIHLYGYFAANRIRVWITGGWGIDALLGVQTRPHKDLDVIIRLDDAVRMRKLLAAEGYALKELWEENRLARDGHGREVDTAFVLHDPEDREVDVHALHLDERGTGIPDWKWEEGFVFTRRDLAGRGRVGGVAVRCISAEKQMQCHTGYELPEYQVADLAKLRGKFSLR